MFRKTDILSLPSLPIALLTLVVLGAPVLAFEKEADLLTTLKNRDASLFDKAIACKQLAVVGTEAAVPVLASLLDDEKLSHYARYGLEPIPSPKVDEVLVSALSTVRGRHLIGVINSIANRGKPQAIGALAEKLNDKDRTVASAAAHSIARLGTPAAGKILTEVLSPEFAAAGLVCGKTLAKQGYSDQAVAMLVKINAIQGAAQHIRLAAMLQAVDIQQAGGLDMLTAALASNDKHTFNMGLRAARLVKQSGASQAALAALKKATPAHQALLVTLLGDLAGPAGLPAVVEAAASGDAMVRVAALGALATLGNASHVPLLIDAAVDESEAVSAQAQKTLAAISGDDVDRAMLALLDDKQRQAMAIRQVGQRRITAAVPKLLALLDGPNRLDVVAALGETIELDQLDVLGRLLDADSEQLRNAARDALHAACYRMPDRDATAAKLAGYLTSGSEQTVSLVMHELSVLGGDKALATVAQAAKSNRAVQKEYATQALGEWLDTSAAPVLLELAKAEGTGKYGIRGLRGYIRLARQFSMPDEQRLAMCRTALEAAQRDAEKKLVLEVAERYPSVDMLKLAVDATKIPALKTEASRTALVIAQKIGGKSRNTKKLLEQMGQKPVKIEILKAEYGAGTKWKDVTAVLKKYARDFPLIVLPSSRYNDALGGDPVRGLPKQLKIQYRFNGKLGEASFRENTTILLPPP